MLASIQKFNLVPLFDLIKLNLVAYSVQNELSTACAQHTLLWD